VKKTGLFHFADFTAAGFLLPFFRIRNFAAGCWLMAQTNMA